MDISQFDKYGTGPLREKALADYLEALDGEDDGGTPGGNQTLQQITDGPGAGVTTNPLYASDFNSTKEGDLASAISYDQDGGTLTLKEFATGKTGTIKSPAELSDDIEFTLPATGGQLATEAYVDANAGGGGGSTLASPDGSIWGIIVTNGGALDTVKLAESGEGGTIHVFAQNATEWNVTISNLGVLSTTQI